MRVAVVLVVVWCEGSCGGGGGVVWCEGSCGGGGGVV